MFIPFEKIKKLVSYLSCITGLYLYSRRIFHAQYSMQLFYTGNVSFAEFAEYVVHRWSSGTPTDRHWEPQHQICGPCNLSYDFIGHFENLDKDAKYVLAKLTATGREGSSVSFPYKNSFDSSVSLSQRLKHFYAEVSQDVVRKLVHMYKLDYELFGYDYSWLSF